MYAQLSDFTAGEYNRSAIDATCRPVRNAIKAACTATGTSVDRDGVEAIAAAAKRPGQRPIKKVVSCLVTSSQFFSA
jgi:hypothetical protein